MAEKGNRLSLDLAALPVESSVISSGHRFPGFDGLRLLAAGCVLFSHAFLIATGSDHDEPFVRLLGAGNIVGLYGVYTFFIISGFLLARSLAHHPSVIPFAINRTLRIYPGFIFCALVIALVLGPIGSSLPWSQYLSKANVLGYVTSASLCLCDNTTLPGVYAYQGEHDLQKVVNGSLWSLSFEVLSYLLLVWFCIALRNIKAVAVALTLLTVAATAFPAIYKTLPGVTYTLPYFTGGVVMFAVYQRFGTNPLLAASCGALLLIFAVFGLQRTAYALFGAYLIVFLGSRPNIGSTLTTHIGDLSYGVYLFGWPVEQLIKQYTQTESPWQLMALSAPLVLMLAAVSYRLIERPALRFKRPLTLLIQRMLIVRDPLKQRATRSVATLTFLAATAAILMSEARWWPVTRSLAEIVVWTVAGAALALVVVEARRVWRAYLEV